MRENMEKNVYEKEEQEGMVKKNVEEKTGS